MSTNKSIAKNLLYSELQQLAPQLICRIEFVSIEAIKQCVIAGIGIALLPAMAVDKEIKAGQLLELPWQWSEVDLYTQLAWHKDVLVKFFGKNTSPLLLS
ncbi:substrate-binding domain-containing protein [Brevibacillus choshinensis]|uniref:substrate-binding domain-containing protein n=1 Tax=Brevibacillus choshinensis TaxID=54911 RepID=UPI002E22918A|nr:substrate-binding domain-containing protein [Brevibacillus choshinensis]